MSTRQENGQAHAEQRIYKMGGELLSPVDSGIGAELPLIDSANIKSEFFNVVQASVHSQGTPLSADLNGPLSQDRRDAAGSHREHSPVVIPKL